MEQGSYRFFRLVAFGAYPVSECVGSSVHREGEASLPDTPDGESPEFLEPLEPLDPMVEDVMGHAIEHKIRRDQQSVDEEVAALYEIEHELREPVERSNRVGLAIAGVTIAVASVGVGLWASNNGDSDDPVAEASTTTVDEASTTSVEESSTTVPATDSGAAAAGAVPTLGEGLILYGTHLQGVREETEFVAYIAAGLAFAEDQSTDEQHPRYVVDGAQVFFTDVDQTEVVGGCTYTGSASAVSVDGSAFLQSDQAGYVEFDLTQDPPTYRSVLMTTDLTWDLTHTCPSGNATVQNYGDRLVWVDTVRSGGSALLTTDLSPNPFIYDSYDGGSVGYVDAVWVLTPCSADTCNAYLELGPDVILQTLRDATFEIVDSDS